MTALEHDAIRELITRHEGYRLGDFLRSNRCVERSDAEDFIDSRVVLDDVRPAANDDHISWHVTVGWNDAINRRAIVSHRHAIHGQRNIEDWAAIWDRDVRHRNSAWKSKPARSCATRRQEHLSVDSLVARSGALLKSAFVAALRNPDTLLRRVVARAIVGVRATTAARLRFDVPEELGQWLSRATSATETHAFRSVVAWGHV